MENNNTIDMIKNLSLQAELELQYICENTVKQYAETHDEWAGFAHKVSVMTNMVERAVRGLYSDIIRLADPGELNEEDVCYILDVFKTVVNQEVTCKLEDKDEEWSVLPQVSTDGKQIYAHRRYPSLRKVVNGNDVKFLDLERFHFIFFDAVTSDSFPWIGGPDQVFVEAALNQVRPIKMPYMPAPIRVYIEGVRAPGSNGTNELCAFRVSRVITMKPDKRQIAEIIPEKEFKSLCWEKVKVVETEDGKETVTYNYRPMERGRFWILAKDVQNIIGGAQNETTEA